MPNYITIDGGTTNTRIYLVRDYKVVDKIKFTTGINKTKELENEINRTIKNLLAKHNLTEKDITKILASGMITSEFGLCNLEHITIPAGKEELKKGIHEVVINEISEIPFCFIRGVMASCHNLEDIDVMRGEETELMGILGDSDCLYVLPGSHSKIIETDKKGRIINFSTHMTGEMIAALSGHTVLNSAFDLNIDCVDEKYLFTGYNYCIESGLNNSLFKVRMLKNIKKCTSAELYSFFIGAVICGEIEYIIKSHYNKIVLGGQKKLRKITAMLLKEYTNKQIIILSDKAVDESTAIGAVTIYETVL